MKQYLPTLALFINFIFFSNCAEKKVLIQTINESPDLIAVDTFSMYDSSRNRIVPVARYTPAAKQQSKKSIPIIFNHGYGKNKGGDYLFYSYLTEYLAANGYTVFSIQHELPQDPLLAMEEPLLKTRMPNWENGVANIHFTSEFLKKSNPNLDFNKLILIGHSNGGDIAVLYTHIYPQSVYKLVTLDHRRMPMLRNKKPLSLTLRSDDFPADEGVLPNAEEKKLHNIEVVWTIINHGRMDYKGSDAEKSYIKKIVLNFLEK